MTNLIFALGILLALWLGLQAFARLDPKAVLGWLRRLGFGLLVLLGLWLVVTGKLAGLFAVAVGLTPWIGRAMRLHGLWKMMQGLGIRMKGGTASAGQASRIQSRFLSMELDHDSGRLDGVVLEGSFRGRRLSGLDRAEALALWRELRADDESARLAEAWLDRAWPDWRDGGEEGGQTQAEAPRAKAGMSAEEAREILGLGPQAGPEEIKQAHRRLMLANHPDHGGSTWIAARINQARDLLLGG